MIGRIVGLALASAVALAGVAIAVALMVYEFFGSDVLARAWESVRAARTAQVEKSELDRARGFSFFTEVPVEGHAFDVTTGVRFSTLADLLAGRQEHRWCYVLLQPGAGGVPRQITLAHQNGAAPPVFNDLAAYPEAELRALGVDAKTLAEIARTQCRFCCPDGRLATIEAFGSVRGRRAA